MISPYLRANIVFLRGEKLNPHSHHSDNTHLIVSGSLFIGVPTNHESTFIKFSAGQYIPVPADFGYRAVAGARGCTFVEGHRRLSVGTAERFVTKGAMKRVARPGEGHVEADNYGEIVDPGFGGWNCGCEECLINGVCLEMPALT